MLELSLEALKCHEIKYPARVSEVSYYGSYPDYEVFFTLFFLFCSFYFCAFFLICCFSVLSSSRRRWTLRRAASHSHSVRIDWPNFLEKVFLFHFVSDSLCLSFFSEEISDRVRSVSVAPASNEICGKSRLKRCALHSAQPYRQTRTSILDYSAELWDIFSDASFTSSANLFTVITFYNICTWLRLGKGGYGKFSFCLFWYNYCSYAEGTKCLQQKLFSCLLIHLFWPILCCCSLMMLLTNHNTSSRCFRILQKTYKNTLVWVIFCVWYVFPQKSSWKILKTMSPPAIKKSRKKSSKKRQVK